MKIIAPNFEILDPQTRQDGEQMLRTIESIARVSHRSEDRQTEDSWKRFIDAVVIQKGDWSVVEHCTAAVKIRVDRGVSHEWVRHRIGSITQESTRFVRYGNEPIEFVEPEWPENIQSGVKASWRMSLVECEANYSYMLANGVSPQIARSILPNALATTLIATYNLRNWKYFLTARTTRETHPDFRRITIPLLAEFKARIPLLFDNIEPNQKQSIAFSTPR